MKGREKTSINLDFLQMKFETFYSRPDRHIRFELDCWCLTMLNLLTINTSLLGVSIENYNLSLLTVNLCTLSRRLLLALYTYYGMIDPVRQSFSFLLLNLLALGTVVTCLCCLSRLIVDFALLVLLILLFPVFSWFYSLANQRYAAGYTDCSYSLKQLLLHLVQLLMCGGYLPYLFLKRVVIVNSFTYCSCLFTTLLTQCALHIGELLAKRGPELQLHAKVTGHWEKTKETHQGKWSPFKKYFKGAVVLHNLKTWKSVSALNVSEPGILETWYLFWLFSEPLQGLLLLNICTGSCLVLAVLLLVWNQNCPQLFSLFSLLYVQFKNTRKMKGLIS